VVVYWSIYGEYNYRTLSEIPTYFSVINDIFDNNTGSAVNWVSDTYKTAIRSPCPIVFFSNNPDGDFGSAVGPAAINALLASGGANVAGDPRFVMGRADSGARRPAWTLRARARF